MDLPLSKIQSVNFEVPGFFGEIFHFGTINILTIVGDLEIKNVEHPEDIYNKIQDAISKVEMEEENEEYDAEYKPSVAWDLEKGDFVCESPFCMLKSEGLEAYKTWCVKAVATERYSCLGYDDDIGAEMEDAMKEEDDTAVELAIERTIEEALMVNPRTESVEDFEFEWEPSVVHVKFTVYAIHWEKFDLEVTLKRR